jgi:GAF domain-containing protein
MLEEKGQEALNALDPVSAMRALMQGCYETLGNRSAHLIPGALLEGEHQYFVAGAFFVTPDRRYHMICANVGFPSEQERLCIPIDGGHPGQVYASQTKKILKNTDEHGTFRQYLKSSRMGSTIFAPLIWQGQFIGQLIVAAQARNTMRDEDLQALVVVARLAASVWVAKGGPQWLTANYPPVNGFYVDREGVKD